MADLNPDKNLIKQLAAITPPERAAALVGFYLQAFASMESRLEDAIIAALELGYMQGLIVCKNLQFRDKLHILKTLINLNFPNASPKQKHYLELIEKTGKKAPDRNMVAHCIFAEDDDGDGVKFLFSRAKGRLEHIIRQWTIAKLVEKVRELNTLDNAYSLLETEFKTAPLSKVYEMLDNRPNEDTFPPELANLLDHLFQEPPDWDSGPPIRKKGARTPPSSQE